MHTQSRVYTHRVHTQSERRRGHDLHALSPFPPHHVRPTSEPANPSELLSLLRNRECRTTRYLNTQAVSHLFVLWIARHDDNRRHGSLAIPTSFFLLFVQEIEKARQAQESVLRDLRTKSEADTAAHAEEIERLKVIAIQQVVID